MFFIIQTKSKTTAYNYCLWISDVALYEVVSKGSETTSITCKQMAVRECACCGAQ